MRLEKTYLIMWDMKNSTEAVRDNFEHTLKYLAKVARTAMHLAKDCSCVLLDNTGDGQIYGSSYYIPSRNFATRLSESAKLDADYQISIILARDEVYETPLGPQAKVFWRTKQIIRDHNARPNDIIDLTL